MAISKKITKQIIADIELRAKIAKAANCSDSTVTRWAKKNHKNLTLLPVLSAIEAYTGLTRDEILAA